MLPGSASCLTNYHRLIISSFLVFSLQWKNNVFCFCLVLGLGFFILAYSLGSTIPVWVPWDFPQIYAFSSEELFHFLVGLVHFLQSIIFFILDVCKNWWGFLPAIQKFFCFFKSAALLLSMSDRSFVDYGKCIVLLFLLCFTSFTCSHTLK